MSVVSAIAARPGRSRSKRPTNSAAKCCASPAEPPLPQASTLPPPVMQPTSALTASAIGLASTSAAWYLRSALSKNCCWMRCSSMVADDKTRPGAGPEPRAQPASNAARSHSMRSPSIATTSKRHGGGVAQRAQVVLRREHQARAAWPRRRWPPRRRSVASRRARTSTNTSVPSRSRMIRSISPPRARGPRATR